MRKLLLLAAAIMICILPACVPAQVSVTLMSPTVVRPSPEPDAEIPTILPTTVLPEEAASPPPTSTEAAAAVPSAVPTLTVTALRPPVIIPTASPTPWPTPRGMPSAPQGWRWRLYADGIPVTHYIIYELSPGEWKGPLERPYGLDDTPLPGLDVLPRSFLMQTAYQGSGRLPTGDILQFAAVRPPEEQGEVPFRYLITPAARCDGHPVAGNRTCSVPLETAATTWREGEEPLVPVGSTIFIPEVGLKIRINDVAFSSGPPKIDLYTGTINNYDYERPDGAEIWILEEEKSVARSTVREVAFPE